VQQKTPASIGLTGAKLTMRSRPYSGRRLSGRQRLEFPTGRLSGERGNTHATGFLVKIANPPAVSIMQFALSARLPIIKRPSLANSVISSPVSFLKSLPEIHTDIERQLMV
jgi:hypothetical protein